MESAPQSASKRLKSPEVVSHNRTMAQTGEAEADPRMFSHFSPCLCAFVSETIGNDLPP